MYLDTYIYIHIFSETERETLACLFEFIFVCVSTCMYRGPIGHKGCIVRFRKRFISLEGLVGGIGDVWGFPKVRGSNMDPK